MDDYVRNVDFHIYFHGVLTVMVGSFILMIACFMAWCGTWFWNMKLIIGVSVTIDYLDDFKNVGFS